MKKNLKIIFVATIAIFSFTGLILFSFFIFPLLNQYGSNTGKPNLLSEVHNISLTVEYVNYPTEYWENFSLYEYNTAVLDALEEKCEVELSFFSNGALVVSINGVFGDWVYYVNGLFAGVGAADYYLNHGDNIHWKRVNV
ncbi:MAG: DUF4430 domain-containing protein [Promethearchaeota archaeon]|nr:MAG: DUF4430 domain-containing protein [Candidatus Lokiarchaeota archaeon]